MAHKVFISYKKEDLQFKNQLVSLFSQKHVDVIDKSLNEIIPSKCSEEKYNWQMIFINEIISYYNNVKDVVYINQFDTKYA